MATVTITANVFFDNLKTGEKALYDKAKAIVEKELGGTITDDQFINMLVKQAMREIVRAEEKAGAPDGLGSPHLTT